MSWANWFALCLISQINISLLHNKLPIYLCSMVLTTTFLLHNDFPILFWKYILLFSLSFYCSCFKRRNCKLVLNIVLLDKVILSSLFPVIPLPFLELWKSMYCIPNAKSHTVVFLVKHISSFVDHEQHHIQMQKWR